MAELVWHTFHWQPTETHPPASQEVCEKIHWHPEVKISQTWIMGVQLFLDFLLQARIFYTLPFWLATNLSKLVTVTRRTRDWENAVALSISAPGHTLFSRNFFVFIFKFTFSLTYSSLVREIFE